MNSSDKKTIAVFGATGHQGAGVVRALMANDQFKVRALTRQPDTYQGPADEVIAADLDRPETLAAALAGAHGVFLVTNYWQDGSDEMKQAKAAIDAAKTAGVDHMIWSTLPNVEAISGGKISLPQFTGKAKIDPIVEAAGFAHHTFVVPPPIIRTFRDQLAPKSSRTADTAGFCQSTRAYAASTWVTLANSAALLPVRSLTPRKPAKACISRSSVIF